MCAQTHLAIRRSSRLDRLLDSGILAQFGVELLRASLNQAAILVPVVSKTTVSPDLTERQTNTEARRPIA